MSTNTAVISRCVTMRWRAESVRPQLTQFTSQKPHSIHLSTSGNHGVDRVGAVLHKAGLPLWNSALPKPFNGTKLADSEPAPKRVVYFRMRWRQGLWSHTTGIVPPSEATASAASSSAVLPSAMSGIPLLSHIIPQHRPSQACRQRACA